MAPPPAPAPNAFKRPKLKIACQECRDRKVRCDGTRPVCNSCTRKRCADRCVYATAEGAQVPAYVRSLEKRLHELEGCRAQETGPASQRRPSESASQPLDAPSPAQQPAPHSHPPPSRRESPIRPQPSGSPSTSRTALAGQNSPHGSGNDYARDRRPGRINTANGDGDHHSPAFLGSASAVGFMKEVYGSFQTGGHRTSAASAETPTSTDTAFPVASSWFYDGRAEDDDIISSAEEFLLPPRRSADALVHAYFDCIHHEMPVFYKPAFLQRYERLWTSSPIPISSQSGPLDWKPTLSDQLFHCMLGIIFALGCEFRQPQADHTSSSNLQKAYIKRATSLLNLETITRPSLSLVQTLVLMARYHQHKGLSNRCWVIVGIAIRTAQGIGLHLDVNGESQAQREERRRTWAACVSLDRVQSMTYGRPLMLSNYSQPIMPQLIDDEFLQTDPLEQDGKQPANTAPGVAFFVYGLKFSEVTLGIMKSFYNGSNEQNIEGDLSKLYTSVLDHDTQVRLFWEEIPGFLRYHGPNSLSDDNVFFSRQACLLHIRLLNAKIMMFRIALVHFAMQPFVQTRAAMANLQWHFMQGCLEGCSSAAKDLIDLIHSNLGTNAARGFLPPGWYTTFLTYTAGTVLVVILRAPTLRKALAADQLESMERSRALCIAVLEEFHRIGVPVAQKCTETLRKVYEDGEIERQERSDAGQYGVNVNSINQLRFDTSNSTPQTYQHMVNESSGWAANAQPNAEMTEAWWQDTNMDWLNGLVEFGQLSPMNGYHEFVGLQ